MERTMTAARTGRSGDAGVGVGSGNALRWFEGVLRAVGSTCSPGRNGKWQCPAHARTGAHARSLAVGVRDGADTAAGTGTAGPDGVWVFCHAGCPARDVAAALGLNLDQLRRPPRISPARWVRCRRLPTGFPAPKDGGCPRSEGYRHERFHHYGRDVRLERMRHPVTGNKAVGWWARNHRGEWVPGLLGTREADLPLYREHEVVAAVALGETVLLVESESSADALTGWYATTWAGGAGAPALPRLTELLADHPHVVIIGDADPSGRACTARLAEALPRAAVLISERDGEDARDLHTRLGPARFTERVTHTAAVAARIGTRSTSDSAA